MPAAPFRAGAATVVTAVEHWAAHGGQLPALIDEALAALEEKAARRRRV